MLSSWSVLLVLSVVSASTEKPNIILIVADDLGWNDVGFHGSNQIPTPNIDALAYNGIILNRFYTQPTCTPSRAALLTGTYPMRYGFQGFPMKAGDPRHLPLNLPLLPERLRQLGYKNHLVGKWHLGSAYEKVTPTKRGFDTHLGYWNGFVGYFDYKAVQWVSKEPNVTFIGYDLHDGLRPAWEKAGTYATDLFTERAVEIINRHDKFEPLFLMVSHLAVHTGKNGEELEVPDAEEADRNFAHIKNPKRRLFAEIMRRLDISVGQIMEALGANEMLQNSIVFFMTDNGAQTVGAHENFGSNWPLRGLKFTLYEGGVRGSCVLYSPLLNVSGVVNENLVHVTDLLPTFYSAAGGNTDDLGSIDGVDQWNALKNHLRGPRSGALLNLDELHNVSALIGEHGRYKLINGTIKSSPILESVWDGYYGDAGRGDDDPPYNVSAILQSPTNGAIKKVQPHQSLSQEKICAIRNAAEVTCERPQTPTDCSRFCLFDLKADPCETRNVLNDHPKIFEALKSKLDDYWRQHVKQYDYYVDLNADPVKYNNTWYTWLENTTKVF